MGCCSAVHSYTTDDVRNVGRLVPHKQVHEIQSCKNGDVVALTGAIAPLQYRLRSPFTGTKCVWYRAQGGTTHGKSGYKSTYTEEAAVDFVLTCGSPDVQDIEIKDIASTERGMMSTMGFNNGLAFAGMHTPIEWAEYPEPWRGEDVAWQFDFREGKSSSFYLDSKAPQTRYTTIGSSLGPWSDATMRAVGKLNNFSESYLEVGKPITIVGRLQEPDAECARWSLVPLNNNITHALLAIGFLSMDFQQEVTNGTKTPQEFMAEVQSQLDLPQWRGRTLLPMLLFASSRLVFEAPGVKEVAVENGVDFVPKTFDEWQQVVYSWEHPGKGGQKSKARWNAHCKMINS